MTLAISANNVKITLPKKGNTFYFLGILTMLFFLVIYLGKIYYIELEMYTFLPLILGGFEIMIIFLIICYHMSSKKKNKTNKQDQKIATNK